MSAIAPAARASRRRPRYVAIAATAAQQATAYRIGTLTGVIANAFWIAILYYLWRAAFSQQPRIGTFSWDEMRTYILLAYGINALIGFPAASRMMGTIRTGEIVIDMVRPLNYLRTQLALATGQAAIEGLCSLALVALLGVLVIGIVPPASPLAAAGFVLAVAMGFVTKFLFVFTISLVCFWTINAVGVNWAQLAIVNVLSGALVPIQFLPGAVRVVAGWSPLRGVAATPLGIYLGQYEGWTLAGMLVLQVGWLAALWLLADRAWVRAFRAVEIQGG
jgi:ABC-2 type transport system permease protein